MYTYVCVYDNLACKGGSARVQGQIGSERIGACGKKGGGNKRCRGRVRKRKKFEV